MQPKFLFAFCSSLVIATVACGGATLGGSGADGNPDPGPGGGDGDRNEGNGGGGTPMPAPSCSKFSSTPVASCAGSVAFRSNTALSLKVRDNSCFSSSCTGSITPACNVTVSGTTIAIALAGEACSAHRAASEGCTADCQWMKADCKLPPLPAGEYHVVGVRDEYHPTGELLDTTLVVKDDATETACAESTYLTNP